MLTVLSTFFVSCTKEREVIVVVPNVEVQLNMKQVFNVEEGSLFKSATTRSSYEHEYPSLYKAYFIADETKGDYTAGQLVTTIEVKPGLQTITIPKLQYKVYVTNYISTQASWYTWTDALEQLPQASKTLYLFGSNVIDYKLDIVGEVLVKNPYAAVMIQGSTRITEAPYHYDTNTDYVQVSDGWWLKYIRNKTTNTGVKIVFTTETKQITINDPIEANKVYKYTLLADVPETDTEDNFNVEVEEFEETENREVIVW